MRRRLWWALLLFDNRVCEMSDYRAATLSPAWNCKTPANLNDFDLQPEMKHLPQSHERPTETTLAILRYQVADLVRHSPFFLDFTNPSLKSIANPNDHGGTLEALQQKIEETCLQYCNTENPLQFMTLWLTRGHLARYRLQALAVGLAARFRPELQQPRGGYFDPFPADAPEAPSPCFIRYGRTTIGNLSASIAQSPSWERVTRNSSNSATPARISSAPPTAADGIEAGVRPIHDARIVSGEAADGRYSAKHPMHPEEGAAVEVRGGCGMATRPDGQYHQRGYRADRKEGPSHRRRLAVPPAPLTRLAHHCAFAPADGYAPETGRRPAVRPG